jgi:hypothetical protein
MTLAPDHQYPAKWANCPGILSTPDRPQKRAITLSAGDEYESGTPVTPELYCLRFV